MSLSRLTSSQPANTVSQPSSLVARGQLGDVVGRRIGLDAAQLAEVVDRVAAVAGAAADAEKEQASAAVAHLGEALGEAFDLLDINLGADLAGFVEKFPGVSARSHIGCCCQSLVRP